MSEQQKPATIAVTTKEAAAKEGSAPGPLPNLNIPPQEPLKVDELGTLKARADMLGLTYSNNIGVDALRAKITAHLSGSKEDATGAVEPEHSPIGLVDQHDLPLHEVTDPTVIRERMYKENMRLIRVRITNLNPAKKDLPGEIVTVSNKYLGTVRKFIPFGEMTDNGYHVPMILLKELRGRKFLSLRVRKGKNGVGVPDQQWVKEFAIEELPPLTQKELDQLARQQAAERGE